MATIKAYAPLNMVSSSVWSGWVARATSTEVAVTNGYTTSIYSGHGYQYSGDSIVGGTMTAYYEVANSGALLGEATGFAIPAPVAAHYIQTNNLPAVLSLVLSGPDYIQGSTYADSLHGYGGNDILYGNGGQNYINGGDGIDVAMYAAPRSAFTITGGGGNFSVVAKNGTSRDTLVSIERLAFSDGTLAFDEMSAQVYRLYQAAFARTPDKDGLSYWVGVIDDGVELPAIASSFMASAEFQSKYGANPSDADFVRLLYENVLHREPDPSGYDSWMGIVGEPGAKPHILAMFSESPENKANVAADISGGIWLNWDVFV